MPPLPPATRGKWFYPTEGPLPAKLPMVNWSHAALGRPRIGILAVFKRTLPDAMPFKAELPIFQALTAA